VIIVHLPASTTEEEFETIIRDHKQNIYYSNLVTNIKTNECLGYGFVFFSDYEKSKSFILEMDGKQFKNNLMFYYS
jgi:RNA recognition motif-containing protein